MKVKLNLRSLSALDRLQLAQDIVTAMTNNASFPTPNPSLASVQGLIDDAWAAVGAFDVAKADCDMKLTQRKVAFEAVHAALTNLAAYVQTTSGGDSVKIQSAGMGLRQPPTPIGPLTAPGNLRADLGAQEGSLQVDWNPVRGARTYLPQHALQADGPWTNVDAVTTSTTTIGNLISGSKYFVRVRAVGPAGLSPWSDIACKMAA